MFKKIISLTLIFTLALSMAVNAGTVQLVTDRVTAISIDDINFAVPDKQILSASTINDDFADDSVIVIFTTEASRNNKNKDFTASDFKDIGAARVEDVTRMSGKEYSYVEPVWTAQARMEAMARKDMANRNIKKGQISPATYEAVRQYETVKEAAVENTLVNVDEFRRSLLITLSEPGKKNVLKAIKTLENRDDIRYVGPNYTGGEALDAASQLPNDVYAGNQWAINKIDMAEAWGRKTGYAAVNVGIIDSGINGNHEDLRNRVNAQLSRDFAENTNGLVDPYGHGTHVAGIIGAEGNNGIGVTGINWNVRVVSLRVLNAYGNWGPNGRTAVAMAVNHARDNNIPILNASLVIGYNDSANQVIRDAVASYNGLFVQSAGNYSTNTNSDPRFAGFSNVLVVGSTDQNDNRSSFSNWGSTSTHLFAPGSNILSTYQSGYSTMQGTSMAAPHVAGAAALIKANYPGMTIANIRQSILNGVDKVPGLSDKAATGGRLNVYESLMLAGAGKPVYIMATAGAGGAITGGGLYIEGDTVTLTAAPNNGYTFDGWYENNVKINGAGVIYSFAAENFRILEARFK